MLEWVPGSFQVMRHVRPKLCCTGCDVIVQAPAPSRPIDRGLAGPGLLAHVLTSKFCDHLPLYRQSEIYAREGVELDRSTLAKWVGKPTSCWSRWSKHFAAMSCPRTSCMAMTRRFRCWLPATARRRRGGSGPMFAMIVLRR